MVVTIIFTPMVWASSYPNNSRFIDIFSVITYYFLNYYLIIPLFSNIVQSGNTSLHGTKLIAVSDYDYQEVLSLTSHVALGTDPEFMDRFVENMKF